MRDSKCGLDCVWWQQVVKVLDYSGHGEAVALLWEEVGANPTCTQNGTPYR